MLGLSFGRQFGYLIKRGVEEWESEGVGEWGSGGVGE